MVHANHDTDSDDVAPRVQDTVLVQIRVGRQWNI